MTPTLIHRLGTDLGDGRSIDPDAVLDLGGAGQCFPVILFNDHRQDVVGYLQNVYRDGDAIWGDVEFFDPGDDPFTPVYLDFRRCDFAPGPPLTLTCGTLQSAHVRINESVDPDCDGWCTGLAHRETCPAHVVPY